MTTYNTQQTVGEFLANSNPFIMEGQVLATNDPSQMGRVRAWVPALDGQDFSIDTLPWAEYASPFMGFTVAYPGGENIVPNNADIAYGFWAIPKVGATVLVFCLNGNPSARCYFASTARLHRNRSLPAGRNTDFLGNTGPWGDAGDGSGRLNAVQPAYDNLRTQFQNNITASEAITRGVYERNAAQAADNKDGKEGYSPNPADPSYLDPQTYCISTPGRHAIIMQDDPKFSRLRFKTAEGHQIIFDDANERVYISTSKGNSWIELDQDGHIHIFGSDSISIRSGGDLNLFADKNVNIQAGNSVNVKADGGDAAITTQGGIQLKANGNIMQSACGVINLNSETTLKITAADRIDVHSLTELVMGGNSGVDMLSGSGLRVTAGDSVDIGGSSIKVQGSNVGIGASSLILSGSSITSSVNITSNGPSAPSPARAQSPTDAACATIAGDPSIVPGFEPWTRPISLVPRGPSWKA